MTKRTKSNRLAGIAKGIYRRAPKAVQEKLKHVIAEALPPEAGREPSQAEVEDEPSSKTPASKIPVLLQDVGTTYDPDVVFPMLALENNILHQQLRTARKETAKLRDRLNSGSPDKNLKSSSNPIENAAALADKYLAGQPDQALRHLVLTHEYPRKGNKSTNKEVHRRVKNYLAAGISVDVVCADATHRQGIYEFDGVRVLTGSGHEITEVLKRQSYKSVSVHFLNSHIWSPIEPFLQELDVHIFIHKYEISRWVRKVALYESGKQLEDEIRRTIEMQHFWYEVLHHPHQPKSYIFDSDWRRRAASDDLLVSFPSIRVAIISTNIESQASERAVQDSVIDLELSTLGLRD